MKNIISIETLYQLFINCNQKITTDTRKIENGAIFFALKGDNFNANTFAQKALELGCKYAIVDDESVANNTTIFLAEDVLLALQNLAKHHRKQLKIPFIGITGSNGKTTNKELINAVLSKKYSVLATIGNLNNHIGVPLTILQITHKHQIAIIEMGANHQGEIEFLSELTDPDFGLITNIGKAHLEGFGGLEGIKKGKSELYKHIKNKNGKLFINGDDEVLVSLSDGIEKIYFGENKNYNVYGKLIHNSEFVELQWNTLNNELENTPIIKTHLFGHYNFINVLCAICIGNYFEVPTAQINDAISNYLPEMNRSQVKHTANNTLILDAYNANPSSMLLAIAHFAKQNFKNNMVILGDMFELGDYSASEHQKILEELENDKTMKCALIGTHFFNLKDKYPHYSFYKTIDEFCETLKSNPITENTILIKGSRGIKLEKCIDFL